MEEIRKRMKTPYDKKILIVDDDESILRMIEIVLRKEGYPNLYLVSSGEQDPSNPVYIKTIKGRGYVFEGK